MKAYCKHCNNEVPIRKSGFGNINGLSGNARYTCTQCGNDVQVKSNNFIITLSIILTILTLFLLIQSVSAYSVTANITSNSLGVINPTFYGANAGLEMVTGGSRDLYRQYFYDSGMTYMRFDAHMENMYSNQTTRTNGVSFTGDYSKYITLIQNNTEHGVKTLIILNYMPSWLADNSSGKCSNLILCPASNYTIWNNIVNDTLYRLSGNSNATRLAYIDVEVWNEPDNSAFFMGAGTALGRAGNYSILYNSTYNYLKTNYPTMSVIGSATARQDVNTFPQIFLNNFANQMQGYSFHFYTATNPTVGNDMYAQTRFYINNASNLCIGSSANCSRIIISEWNDGVQANMTNDNIMSNELSQGYSAMLINPNIINSMVYTFTSSDGYGMINTSDNSKRITYNITQQYTSNHKSGNTVLNSSSNDTILKVVASTDGTKTYITLTNVNSTATNVTLNIGLSNSYLRDVSTNTIYPIQNNQVTINNLAGYGVQTLDSNNPALSITPFASNPSNGSTVNTRYVNLGWNITSINPLDTIIFNGNNTNFSLYDPSLVLYYNFDNRSSLGENDTYVVDISKYGNNATVYGKENISWSNNGRYYGSFNQNGNISYISTNMLQNISNNNFTYSFWFKRLGNSTNAFNHFFNGGSVALNIYMGNSVSYLSILAKNYSTQLDTTLTSSGQTIPNNVWTNVIITYDGSSFKSYINGELSNSIPFYGTLNRTTGLTIGAQSSTYGYLNGSIDEFMIINKSMSYDYVKQLYNYQLTKFNYTQYSFSNNYLQIGTNFNNINLIVNDTSSNSDISKLSIRPLFNIVLKNQILKLINPLTYGVNIHSFLSTCGYQVDTNNDGVVDTCTNTTWAREKFIASKLGVVRRDTGFTYYYNSSNGDGTFNYSQSDFSVETDLVDWAYANGIKVIYITGGLPNLMANKTSGWCNVTQGTNSSCTPLNYTVYGDMTTDFLNKTHCGIYNDACIIEVRNEANLENWLNNITRTNPIKAREYNKLFNATYNSVKKTYPKVLVGGGGVTFEATGAYETNSQFIGNFSNITDIVFFHSYTTRSDLYSVLNDNLNTVIGNITLNGGNVSRIFISEFNFHNASITNASDSTYWNLQVNQFAKIYNLGVSNKNFNITLVPYQWADPYYYGQYYPEYPYFYSFVSEPQLQNMIYPIYSLSANFTRYGIGTLYNTSSDNSEISSVGSKLNSACSLIAVNSINDYQNVSVSFDTNSCGNNLIDTSNGNLISNGSSIVLNAYDVRSLTTPYYNYENGRWVVDNYLGEFIRYATQDEIDQYSTTNPVAAVNDNGFAKTVLNILLGIFAIGIVGIGLWFLKFYYDDGNLTPEKIVAITIAIILALVFIRILADVIIRL